MHQLNIRKVSTVMSIEDFGKIYAEYFEELVKHFKKKQPRRNDHEDLAQETLIQAWNSKDRYQDCGKLRGWLHTIANRVLISTVKHEMADKRKNTGLSEAQEIEAVEDLPSADGLFTSKLFLSIDDLPSDYRHVLMLRARGYGVEDCAKLLKISNGTVSDRFKAAREMLSGKVRS